MIFFNEDSNQKEGANENIEMVSVPVLNRTLKQDENIDRSFITYKGVRKDEVEKNKYIVDSDDLINKVVACGYVITVITNKRKKYSCF